MPTENFLAAVFLPWLMFALVVTIFIFLYYDKRILSWFLIGACMLLALLLVAVGILQSRNIHLAVGMLCLTALCIGASVGSYTYCTYASTYWLLENGVVYKGVSPLTQGSGYADATLLSFTTDAFVDTERTLGYMENGVVYCVAPVTTQKFSNSPQYWAAGMDCCDQRSDFRCGDTSNEKAKTGLRIWDKNDRDKYNTAIRMAESVYNLSPSETGHYSLTWTASGNNPKDDLWSSCLIILVLTSSMYFICSLGAALILRKSRAFVP